MKLINQRAEIEQVPVEPLYFIEKAGRTCYQSESKSTNAIKFTKKLIDQNHDSVIEHCFASFRLITNRGVTHELVRHRLASYSQESTRYVKYNPVVTRCIGAGIEFIKPVWWYSWTKKDRDVFRMACYNSEIAYHELIKSGSRPEQAREVLPNALKTEIVMTANLREWRHICKLRTSKKAHPQMRHLMLMILDILKTEVPVVFDDIGEE
jgi:thymidylate synthase (FAD)